MDWDTFWALAFIAAVATSIYMRIRRRGRQRVFITDYQCGLRYKDGVFVEKVGPGSYRANGSRDQIAVVDLRPRLFLAERIFYQDALQSPSVISVSGDLTVEDACAATTKLKDFTGDSVTIVRDAIRATVSKSIAGHSREARESTAAEIQKKANVELGNFGMRVSNIEITEAWSRAVEPRMISGAN